MRTSDDDMTNRELFEATAEILETLTDNMATKEDLKVFATKRDLKNMESRLRLATKQDLQGMEDRLAAKINNLRIVSA